MVDPINPKTIMSRSMDLSSLEQNKKMHPEIQQQQIAADQEERYDQQQKQVNETEESEHKRINEEKEKEQKQQFKEKKDQEEAEDSESNSNNDQKTVGQHIDIKV